MGVYQHNVKSLRCLGRPRCHKKGSKKSNNRTAVRKSLRDRFFCEFLHSNIHNAIAALAQSCNSCHHKKRVTCFIECIKSCVTFITSHKSFQCVQMYPQYLGLAWGSLGPFVGSTAVLLSFWSSAFKPFTISGWVETKLTCSHGSKEMSKRHPISVHNVWKSPQNGPTLDLYKTVQCCTELYTTYL